MPSEENLGTWDEYTQFVNDVLSKAPSFPYALEWLYAIGAG